MLLLVVCEDPYQLFFFLLLDFDLLRVDRDLLLYLIFLFGDLLGHFSLYCPAGLLLLHDLFVHHEGLLVDFLH